MLGITFKENCPDVRNTKAVDVISSLKDYGLNITIYDPWASSEEVEHEYGMSVVNELPKSKFDAVVLSVAHNEFKEITFSDVLNENGVLYDVKGILDQKVDGKL